MKIFRIATAALGTVLIVGSVYGQSGNIGIGVDTPSEKLHILDGNIKLENPDRPWLIFDHPSMTLNGGLQWRRNGIVDAELFYDGINEDLRFWDSPNELPRVVFKRTGRVGIGTATPGSLLHVYSEGNGLRGISIDAQGSGEWQHAYIELISQGNGMQRLGASSNKGWHLTARGDSWQDTIERNDLILSNWDGSAWNHRLFLEHSGDIGIGTQDPKARFHIRKGPGNGEPTSDRADIFIEDDYAYLELSGSQAAGTTFRGDTGSGHAGYMYSNTSDRLEFRAGGMNYVQLESDGDLELISGSKLGIGVNEPSFPLHVTSSTDLRSGYFYNEYNTASTTFGVYAGAYGTGSGTKRGGSFEAHGGSGINSGVRASALNGTTNIGLYSTASGGTTNWAAHFDNGYVIVDDRIGIGTTSPAFPLHATTNAFDRTAYFYNNRNTVNTTFGMYAGAFGAGSGNNYAGTFEAYYGTGTNVGVRATASSGTDNIAIYGHASGGTTNWSAHFDSGDVIVDDKLGIGTTTPGAALHVAGTGKLRLGSLEELDDGGVLVLRSNSSIAPSSDNARDLGSSSYRWNEVYSANGVVTTSDSRQKSDIQSLRYGLTEILQLAPVTYKWISGPDQRSRIGLIAQDVSAILPEVVVTENWAEDELGNIVNEPLDKLGMYYADIIPVLIKGIQEQQAMIDDLSAELQGQEEQITKLIEMNAALLSELKNK